MSEHEGATGGSPEAAAALAEELAARGVDGIALNYVDNSGITRVKAIPVRHLPQAASAGVGMSPVFDVFLLDDSITTSETSTGPVGDLRLFPDLTRLVDLAAQPGWAWAPVDRRTQSGGEHPLCHRLFARRMAALAAEAGYELKMSFELEWALALTGGDDFTPAVFGPAYGMTRLVERSDYLRDVLRSFAAEGLEVEQIHPEYAAGQFEVSIVPNDPIGAADDSVLARQTLRGIGYRHGLRTSFAPCVVAGEVGNGGHLHASLWREGRNLFSGGDGPLGLTADAEAFTAGVLRELPALLAVGAPSVASYLRLVPQHWAGAYQTWGLENREAALRLVLGTAGHETRSANIEVKSFDLSASPYLVVGCVIAAGLAGIGEGLRLPEGVTVDPANLPPEEAPKRLPQDLDEALAAYEASELLRTTLGHRLYTTISAVRRAEQAVFSSSSPEEIAARTRWRH